MNTTPRGPIVRTFMTAAPMTVDVDLSIRDAQERMMLNNLRHLVVVHNDRIVGVTSSRDLGLALTVPSPGVDALTVADAMTRDPYCCVADTPVAEVARAMEAHRYGCALVLDGQDMIGIFTTIDALRALRVVITGEDPTPANPPTHVGDRGDQREHVEHSVRASSVLGAGVAPSPNQGKIG